MAELPETIGKYAISQLVAKGGMGAVYKAVHPTLKRNVILKKLTVRGNPQFIERFKREAKIMMDFKHDNIVTVYDHFKEGASYYIVLEYVDGCSLEELVRRERALPGDLALHIFREVCRALKYAHDNGVIHRDVKPANILIAKDGAVKLVDFGIAGYEAGGEGGDENLTTQGMTLGTVSYMPPEQFENTKNVDKGADIYAMGVMLYEMVTGKKPFPGAFSPETLLQIKRGRYVKVRRLNPRVDRTVARLTGKMIRPKKERRYRDLAPVLRILDRRLRGPEAAELEKRLRAAVCGERYVPPKRRGRALLRRGLAFGLPAAAALAGGFAWAELSGRWEEWTRPGDLGTVTLNLVLPAGQAAEAPAAATIGGDGLPAPLTVALPTPAERLAGWLERRPAGLLSSGKLHLAPGRYRATVRYGAVQFEERFVVAPYAVQAAEGRAQGMVLNFEPPPPAPAPLAVRAKVLDARMRQDISAAAWFSLRGSGGEWLAPENFPKDELLSGRQYRCRVSAYGYHTEEFSVDVPAGQTELAATVTLVPLEGRLAIESSVAGLELKINGRAQVAAGGLRPRLQELRLAPGKPLVLTVQPGPLRLSASSGGRTGSADLDIASDASVKVRIGVGGPAALTIDKE